jgi:hypothetical protein
MSVQTWPRSGGGSGGATPWSSGGVLVASALAVSASVETAENVPLLGPGKLWTMNRITCAVAPVVGGDVWRVRFRMYRDTAYRDADLNRPNYQTTDGVEGLLFEGAFSNVKTDIRCTPLVQMLSTIATDTTIACAVRVDGAASPTYDITIATYGDLIEA